MKITLNQILLLGTLFLVPRLYGQNSDLTKNWKFYSDTFEPASPDTISFKGKSSIHLDGTTTAVAIREGLEYRNFRMELDIAGTSMSGIGFHVKDEQTYQFVYFRPAYGGTEEAIQYIPIYNGGLSWIFYNYPTYEKNADIASLEWFHAAIEVKRNRLKVFVNNSETPQMDIQLAEMETDSGELLLRSMFGESYFANISITEPPISLSDWQVSEQLPRKKSYRYDDLNKVKSWKMINDEQNDFVNLIKYFDNPNGVIFAKRTITSESDQQKLLAFDFAGKLKIYLNGDEVFNYGKYKLDRIVKDEYAIALDLQKGDNELVFLTEGDAFLFGEGFNAMGRLQHQNWGFTAQLVNK